MDFYIGNNRAMISFGALNKNQNCTYNCKFCYTNAGFSNYSILTDDEIIKFLVENRKQYEIIYISGDTDSFAPPRTQRAINFLYKILDNIEVDVLFTTRTIFNKEQLNQLKKINDRYKLHNKKLYACISIPRLNSHDYIESSNTPTPWDRIECIKNLNYIGIETILAMRPFLPVISVEEYKEIIKKCCKYVKVILGEGWYTNDEMIKQIYQNDEINYNIFKNKNMDFDYNNIEWKYYEPNDTIYEIKKYCKSLDIKFFMRSQPAIQYLKKLN